MQGNSKVHFIPPISKREQRVGIYCRVSTNSMDQLQSLTAQVSHLTRLTAAMPQWVLEDVYMDIATSKTGSSRKEFNRLLEDCNSQKIEIVIMKNISRFGRDTVEILDALNLSGKSEVQYLSSDNNPAIISKEMFEAVQMEKGRRSNVVKDEKGSKRKNEKYSSKKR